MATVLGPRARRRRRARPRREAGARPAQRPDDARPRTRSTPCSAPPAPTRSPRVGAAGGDDEGPDPSTVAAPEHLARRRPRDRRRRPHPRRRAHARATRRATSSSPTRPPGCSSPATTCCRRSRRRSASRCRRRRDPLGDFMASLTKVRALPDLRILPAHGPVAPSSHARVDELLAFHEAPARRQPRRARRRRRRPATTSPATLGWTRHLHAFDDARRLQPGHGRDGDQGPPRPARRPRVAGHAVARTTAAGVHLRRVAEYPVGTAVTPSRIGTCGMPSSRNSGPATTKPNVGVPAGQRRLGVEHDVAARRRPASAARMTRRRARARAPAGASSDPADPPARRRRRAPGRSRARAVVVLEQHVPGARLEVAAVEVGVGALLLDDEHVLAQPPHGVRRGGRRARANGTDRDRSPQERPGCVRQRPAASGRNGSSG